MIEYYTFHYLFFYLFTLLPFQQIVCELLNGSCPVTDMILNTSTQFGKSLVITIRLEDRIITKALSSPTLTNNLTIDDTFEGGGFSINDQCDDRTETSFTIVLLFQLMQQTSHIGTRVMRLGVARTHHRSITGTIYTWSST